MASCLMPIYVDNPAYRVNRSLNSTLPVPCGKCPPCLSRRASGWSFRLLQQEKVSKNALFVTLTYDNEHQNISKKGYMTLVKHDFQLFVKRLRLNMCKCPHHVISYINKHGRVRNRRKLLCTCEKIRYYMCGEYGSSTWRPHYHAIMYNVNVEMIQKSWGKGLVHTGTVTGASIGYTLKYMSKGKLIPVHKNDDRLPEFSLMSKRLGKNYVDNPQIQAYHQADLTRVYLTLPGGQKVSMPRYYKDKLFTKQQLNEIGEKFEKISIENESRKQRDYLYRYRDISGYNRANFEAVKAALANQKKKALINRTKI